ncbi:MAG TPA: hypothetical protein VFL87_09420 [Thermoleophilaceae bacterium]|nr:hypothetical protein [Thermoleophilaceae bacterium]
MADDVTPPPDGGGAGGELEPAGGRELEPAQSKELQRWSPQASHGHETKFRLTYAVLAGCGIAALIAVVVFALAGKPPKPPAWSTWKPTESGDAALGQIASHVEPGYRLPTGQQLVAVEGGPAEIQGLPVHIVLLRTPSEFSLANGNSALFTLNGLGNNGSITFGKPSRERTLLLQREALELALYTFRYVGDIDQVVVILPPAPKHRASQAMYFRKTDVKPQLARPLRSTLAAKPPSIPSLRSGPARRYLLGVLGNKLFYFDLAQAPDTSVLLELAHFKLPQQAAGATGTP